MILEEISASLMNALENYSSSQKIVIPPPGEESEELKKNLNNPDTRIREIIKLSILIRAIYLPIAIYIRNITDFFRSPSCFWSNPLRITINNVIIEKIKKQSNLRETVSGLLSVYSKNMTERDRVILNYCYAKHNFCCAYQKRQFDCPVKYADFEKDYGGLTFAVKYSAQHPIIPPHNLAYPDEIDYLNLARDIYQRKANEVESDFRNNLGYENNDLDKELDKVEAEIFAASIGLGKSSNSLSVPPPGLPGPS